MDQTPPPQEPRKVPFWGSTTLNAPPVVLALLAVVAGVYLLFVLAPPALHSKLVFELTLWPRRMLMGAAAPGGWLGAVGPLFSSIFVHTEFLHFFVNAGFLLAFGAPVAQRMGVGVRGAPQGAANVRFLAFYLLAGLAGGLAFVAAHPQEVVFAKGASGAISGLLGGALRFALSPLRERLDDPWRLVPLYDRRLLTAALVIVLLNVAIAFIPLFGMRIAGEAHIGGFLFGLLAFPLFALRRPR